MAKRIIIGNWKMNPPTMREAEKLFTSVAKSISGTRKTEIVVCPPLVYIPKLKALSKKINLGAQDVFWEERGAFTGEVSAEIIQSLGVKYVIVGHSERRALGEGDTEVNKKIKAALRSGLTPILCIGERERDLSHSYFNFVKTQLESCLAGISKNLITKVIVAYEPVWAISTTPDRRDATSDDSREMVVFLRKVLSDKFGPEAGKTRIIYGGSVNEKDAGEFLKNGGVDGLLPGKASLDPKKFTEIINICEALSK